MCILNNQSKKYSLILAFVFISVSAYSQNLSDSDIKKNISTIDNPLQKLVRLEPKTYEYKTEHYKHLDLQKGKKYGFLAEDFQRVFPDLVKEKNTSFMFGKNTYRNSIIKTIDEQSIIPILVASIKEQQLQIEKLTAEVEALKNKKATALN
jgi:hypothetical protein